MRRASVLVLVAAVAAMLLGLGISTLIWGRRLAKEWAYYSAPPVAVFPLAMGGTGQQIVVYDVSDIVERKNAAVSQQALADTVVKSIPSIKRLVKDSDDQSLRTFQTGASFVLILKADAQTHRLLERWVYDKRQWAGKRRALEEFWSRAQWVCTAIVVNACIATMIYSWRRHRYVLVNGLCATCNYDLRGSPDGCPECGRGRDGGREEIPKPATMPAS